MAGRLQGIAFLVLLKLVLLKNGEGEENRKAGSVICSLGAAADAQRTAVLLDNALAYPQTQPCAFGIFRCKEGLKNSGQVLRRDSGAVIAYHNADSGLQFRGTITAHAHRHLSR